MQAAKCEVLRKLKYSVRLLDIGLCLMRAFANNIEYTDFESVIFESI